jgi:hypothetical protein
MSGVGWGAGAWGGIPWGSGPGATAVLSATASRENQIQIAFTQAIYFSGILDAADASDPSKYTVDVVAGTVGIDGLPCRPVRVISVELDSSVPGEAGFVLNLNLDRPMSPYPASYVVTVRDVFDAALDQVVLPNPSTYTLFGVFKNIQQPTITGPTPSRDFANAQTQSAAVDSGLSEPSSLLSLGTISYDDTGDYAVDSRQTGFKKRMLRRIIAKPGGFLHLGRGYGVGITTYGKKLGTAATRASVAAQIETQISQEPETEKVGAQILTTTKPGLFRLVLLVKSRGGLTSRYEMPFVAE